MRMHNGCPTLLVWLLVSAGLASAQGIPGSSRQNPYVDTEAGRALNRLFYGAIDCGSNLSEAADFCPNDNFSLTGLFVNGTYQDIRYQYAGRPPGTLDVAETLPALTSQVLDFPQPTSASGFSLILGKGTVPVPASSVFGGLFGEQGLVNGKGAVSLGLSFQSQTLDSYNQNPLGDLGDGYDYGDDAYVAFPDAAFGYVARVNFRLEQFVALGTATVGLTSRLDLRISAPLVRSRLEGSNEFLDYVRFSDGRLSAATPDTFFEPQGEYYVRGDSTALGDIDTSLKWVVSSGSRLKVALLGGARLGTGSTEKLSGTGQSRPYGGIALSLEQDASSVYLNLKGTAGAGDVSAEHVLVAGASARLMADRVTLTTECYWRRQYDVGSVGSSKTFGAIVSPITRRSFPVADYRVVNEDIDTVLFAPGLKARLGGRLLLSIFGVIPMTSRGFQFQNSLNIGLNYLF